MIVKDTTKSTIRGGQPPSRSVQIEFEEICSMCDKEIPNNKLCLRHVTTGNVLCLLCLVAIAEMKIE